MTGEPPSQVAFDHANPIWLQEVTVATLVKLTGASGDVRTIAPLPWTDLGDYPMILIALTTAYTLEPHWRLYGYATNVETGIAQVRLDTI